jgi:hypothetical protein
MDPAGIICGPGAPHEQWPSDTTMPTWADRVVAVFTSSTLKRIGAPPGRSVVGSCAVMVTSMPPADPCACGCGAGDVFVGVLDGVDVPPVDAAELLVVVPELVVLELLELVAVPELEQLTRATTVAALNNAPTSLDDVFMRFLRHDLWLRHGRAAA